MIVYSCIYVCMYVWCLCVCVCRSVLCMRFPYMWLYSSNKCFVTFFFSGSCLACVFALKHSKNRFFVRSLVLVLMLLLLLQKENFFLFFCRATMEKVFNILKLCFVVNVLNFFFRRCFTLRPNQLSITSRYTNAHNESKTHSSHSSVLCLHEILYICNHKRHHQCVCVCVYTACISLYQGLVFFVSIW